MRAKLHGTYLFRDKDPVIDYLRTPRKECRTSTSRLADQAGCAPGTIHNMFDGTTRRPQWATVVRVARAIGPAGEEALVRCIRGGGRGLRVIQGGKQRRRA